MVDIAPAMIEKLLEKQSLRSLARDMEVSSTTGYLLFGIGEGRPVKDLMRTIVDHAARNKNFGAAPDDS